MGTFASGISTDVSADQPRIPVVVLAGFLGSGKTTLLNHLLQDDHGIKLAVIVNDFGTIPVDAMLVAGQVDSVVCVVSRRMKSWIKRWISLHILMALRG